MVCIVWFKIWCKSVLIPFLFAMYVLGKYLIRIRVIKSPVKKLPAIKSPKVPACAKKSPAKIFPAEYRISHQIIISIYYLPTTNVKTDDGIVQRVDGELSIWPRARELLNIPSTPSPLLLKPSTPFQTLTLFSNPLPLLKPSPSPPHLLLKCLSFFLNAHVLLLSQVMGNANNWRALCIMMST